MKRIILIITCSLMVYIADAQDDTVFTKREYPLFVPKFEIGNMMNPEDPSWIFSGEFFPGINWLSLSQDIGYVNNIRSHTGVKIKESLKLGTEIRLYTPDNLFENETLYFYLSLGYTYRKLTITDRYILGFECENNNCVYYQNYKGDFPTTRYAYLLRFGAQARMNRIFLEWDLGLGVYNFEIDPAVLRDGSIVENNRFLNEEYVGNQPYGVLRIKLGYSLFNHEKLVRKRTSY